MPDDLRQNLLGIAPDTALHGHIAIETDAAQCVEGPCEVRVAGSRLEAIAVGEVDVGEMSLCPAYGIAQVVLLYVHVEEVAHDLDRGMPGGLAEFDRLLHAVEHVVLVAVERLEEHERPLFVCVFSKLLQGVEEHAPVLFLRAWNLER